MSSNSFLHNCDLESAISSIINDESTNIEIIEKQLKLKVKETSKFIGSASCQSITQVFKHKEKIQLLETVKGLDDIKGNIISKVIFY